MGEAKAVEMETEEEETIRTEEEEEVLVRTTWVALGGAELTVVAFGTLAAGVESAASAAGVAPIADDANAPAPNMMNDRTRATAIARFLGERAGGGESPRRPSETTV